ncbi:gamma-glutamylcyclotransferase [Pseudovibrio exalbescens]|uniref:gamma-glutamylcyclotransferase n=1 Tax=Pseudovibrio exalbescens TaxID=197461 RepID=UPI00236584D6|nr:gamma-glutamylcyclotransferase [Pseudovibrio exalbescens]MDD7909472.1 gamma-glutamylcyclotransferase [Pseudovibrio exalbescens]
MRDLWVFGYGSLIWRPGFDYEEAVPALLRGAHRSLCVYSWVHRGTQDDPGLVFGLDRGGSCRGMAFRVAAKNRDRTITYLREREQQTMVYRETVRGVQLDGRPHDPVQALTYVADRSHAQYAGALPLEEQLKIVLSAKGQSGANPEYVINTARHMRELGIRDHGLEWLEKELTRLVHQGTQSAHSENSPA